MSDLTEDVLRIARGWIGTPYRHQGASRGAGADCLGLIRGVWRELYGAEPVVVPAYAPDWSEPQREERLWEAAGAYLWPQPLASDRPADVLLFRMRDGAVAKHLGIRSEAAGMATVIHAYSGHGVIESPLSRPWQRRIVARFRFPGEVI